MLNGECLMIFVCKNQAKHNSSKFTLLKCCFALQITLIILIHSVLNVCCHLTIFLTYTQRHTQYSSFNWNYKEDRETAATTHNTVHTLTDCSAVDFQPFQQFQCMQSALVSRRGFEAIILSIDLRSVKSLRKKKRVQ